MRRMYDKDEIADIAGGGGIGELNSIDFPYGQESVTYDTTDGITMAATARLTHGGSNDTTDVPTTLSVPLIASDGIVMDANTANTKVNIKVDAIVPRLSDATKSNVVPVWANGQWVQKGVINSSIGDTIALRGANGTLYVGTPTSPTHAATKAYVDTAVAGAGGEAVTKVIATGSNYPTYTYTPEGKAVKIDFTISAQKIGADAELSIKLLGTTDRTIITQTVTSGQEFISGTIYHVPSGVYVNTSASETSGSVQDKLMGVATLVNVTDGSQVILKQDTQDVTGIEFKGQATGPTGTVIWGLITITPLT